MEEAVFEGVPLDIRDDYGVTKEEEEPKQPGKWEKRGKHCGILILVFYFIWLALAIAVHIWNKPQNAGMKARIVQQLLKERQPRDPITQVRKLEDPDDDGVEKLTYLHFDEFVSSNEHVFVNFYAPWCAHSQRLQPVWAELSEQAKDHGIKVVKVDCAEEALLCEEQNIRAYPIVRWFHNGKHDCSGEYKRECSREFLMANARCHMGDCTAWGALAAADTDNTKSDGKEAPVNMESERVFQVE